MVKFSGRKPDTFLSDRHGRAQLTAGHRDVVERGEGARAQTEVVAEMTQNLRVPSIPSEARVPGQLSAFIFRNHTTSAAIRKNNAARASSEYATMNPACQPHSTNPRQSTP